MSEFASPQAIDYEPERHRYSIGGVEMPSVSRIIKRLVEDEYRFAKSEDMDRGAILGTAVALAIELDLEGTLDESSLHEAVIPHFENWREFRKKSGFEPTLCETIVHSKRYGYCGRIDLFGSLNKRPALIDAKRTASVVRTVRPQTAGYAIALVETEAVAVANAMGRGNGAYFSKPENIDRYALHLPKPPAKWKLVPLKAQFDFRVFLAELTHYQWQHEKRS